MEKKSIKKTKVTKTSASGVNSRKTVCLEPLARGIAVALGLKKRTVTEVVKEFISRIKSELSKKNPVYIAGFFRLQVKKTGQKSLINPKTKERITIPEHDKVFVKLCDNIKNAVKISKK